MKKLYLIPSLFLLLITCNACSTFSGSPSSSNGSTRSDNIDMLEGQRLEVYQAKYDELSRTEDKTKDNLKEAKKNLDDAQDAYKQAKEEHKNASEAAKQAKKALKAEEDAQKAREKARKASQQSS